jgi:putative phage-type endonuclease
MTEQRTEAWYAEKLGRLSASRVYDIIPGKRGSYLESRNRLMWEVLAERITGKRTEKYVTAAMQYGIDMEPVARAAYTFTTHEDVVETGFHVHPTISGLGASPDGLVGTDGLLEIKVPNTETALKAWAGEEIDPRYMYQMQCQMACTGRQWCDFVVYDPRLPLKLELYIKGVKRDKLVVELIEYEARKFLAELGEIEGRIRERMK